MILRTLLLQLLQLLGLNVKSVFALPAQWIFYVSYVEKYDFSPVITQRQSLSIYVNGMKIGR